VAANTAEILLHPIRLRIVLAMGSEELTTAELAERLPDIAQATLYRQVAALVEAGLLSVIDERRVRGGVERTYALSAEAANIGPAEAEAMSEAEHLRGLVTFVGSLIEAYGRYLADPAAAPGRDTAGFRQAALWLDDAEGARLVKALASVIGPYLANEPTAERRRVMLNTNLIPDLTASPRAEPEDSE
jgi:DNA-binding transcriptional ArsR family regulator